MGSQEGGELGSASNFAHSPEELSLDMGTSSAALQQGKNCNSAITVSGTSFVV